MTIKTDLYPADSAEASTRRTRRGPEIEIPLPSGGTAHVRNVGYAIAGMFPMRPDDDDMGRIAVMLVDEKDGEGMYFLMNPEEARTQGEALLRLADKEHRDQMEATFEARVATKQ